MPALPTTAVILCGGRGVRAWPATDELPKPLLSVGDAPVLGHLLDVYARQGVRRFVLATGYLGHLIEQWAQTVAAELMVVYHDTGEDTATGERLRRCVELIDGPFFATYGDGLGNIDLAALWSTHHAAAERGALATVTTVPLPSQYGTVEIDDDGRVLGFLEKPVLSDHWINAGFFVLEPDALSTETGPDLERDVLPALARDGRLHAHRHGGFWMSMDTAKDIAEATELAAASPPPWLASVP